jgi:hypothetical protein
MHGAVLCSLRADLKSTGVSMMKGEKTMKRSMRYRWVAVSLCVGLLVGGCAATYYKVTDPQSGKEYYTEKIDNVTGGAVKVMDSRTGSIITLQNSEVKEISEKEYKAGLAPVSNPAPAAAPASAPTAAPSVAPAPTPAPAAAPVAAPAPTPAAEPSSAPSGTK